MKIGESLELLEISTESLKNTTDVMMNTVKKAFLKAALRHHPDKGGREEVFIIVQKAWDTLRAAFEMGADLSRDLDFDPSSTKQWAAQKKKQASTPSFQTCRLRCPTRSRWRRATVASVSSPSSVLPRTSCACSPTSRSWAPTAVR
eukprot:979806-Prymnesium_polylepis.1